MPTWKEIVDIQEDKWDTRVHSQYAMAYNDAFQNFQKTASSVESAEKAKADFFATIVAVMSCSVGIAALGESWLSRLVLRTGLRTLGVANTRTVANWVREGQQHAVVGFVFGRALDGLKDAASDRFKAIAASLVEQVAGGITDTDPLNRKIELDNLLKEQANHLTSMGWAIEGDRKLSETQRSKAMAVLREAPFWRPPVNTLHKDKLAQKIELAFYLNTVLAGDHYLTHFPPDMRTPPQRGPDITLMPSDPKYPRSQSFTGQVGTYNTVEIDRPAMGFQDKIDELHKQIFGSPFYEASWLWRKVTPNQGMGRPEELSKAEQTLVSLSNMTRPKNAMIVAF